MMNGRPRRILFADDDDNFRELSVLALREAGYDVRTCRDGVEALAALRQTTPDLILCDVVMPRMDGLELLRTVRSSPQWSTLPLVLVSAKADAADRRLGMSLGADDYVTKPFAPADLLRTIELRLQRAALLKAAAQAPHFLARVLPQELRPQLAGILAAAERMQQAAAAGRTLASAELEDLGRLLSHRGRRLLRLTEDFVLWTKYELAVHRLHGGCPPETSPVPLSGIELARQLRQCAYDCGRNPDLEVHVNGAMFAAQVPGVERVLLHLVENAFIYSRPGARVSVTDRVAAGAYSFEVRDQGRGMTPEQLRRIREYRKDAGEPHELSGPGLGLVLAGRLALLTGGELVLEPNLTGPGLTVRLVLPLGSPAADPNGPCEAGRP